VNDLFQVSKFKTKVEDVKFMERELSMHSAELYTTFTENRAKRAIVPDIAVTNHPMITKCIDAIHYGTARTKTAIFEVKGIMKCPTRYATDISPTTKRATDLRARQVEKDYAYRMKNMDHDNATGPGPCTKVLRSTFGGKIQVIVPGAFGEANKELDPLVHRLAKLTAKTPLGQMLSPQNQSKWKIC
jgi:hypothetical protein